jgi:hypothetical protein
MTIDITREPPVDIFRNRSKYSLLAIASLALSICGMLLAAYAIFSDMPHSKKLETVAFTLFVGPGLVFSYFGQKLQSYKKLTPEQEKELAIMVRRHSEVNAYCDLVLKAGRQMTHAEYEACQGWADEANRKIV